MHPPTRRRSRPPPQYPPPETPSTEPISAETSAYLPETTVPPTRGEPLKQYSPTALHRGSQHAYLLPQSTPSGDDPNATRVTPGSCPCRVIVPSLRLTRHLFSISASQHF